MPRRYLDQELWDVIRDIPEDYTLLPIAPNREVVAALEQGDYSQPLCYPRVTDAVLDAYDTALGHLEQLVPHVEPVVQRAYSPLYVALTWTRRMLACARNADDAGFAENARLLYGRPKKDYYSYTLRELARRFATQSPLNSDARVREARELLAALVSEHTSHGFLWDVITLPTEIMDNDVRLTADQVVRLFEAGLVPLGLNETVQVRLRDSPDQTNFAFDLINGVIYVPQNDALQRRVIPTTERQMKALFAHEAGKHALSQLNGVKSPLRIFGKGLAEYLRGEEGIAEYFAQLVTGTRSFEVRTAYFTAGYAEGVDRGGVPRRYHEVYVMTRAASIISQIDRANYHGYSIDAEMVVAVAESDARQATYNYFRGTSGRTPGLGFPKGIVYLEGNIAIWQLITEKPAWEQFFTLGKFDPTNPEHVGILTELGMVPDNL